MVVDYDSQASLQHAVMGVDTVISTITGDAQLNLLRAALARRVRRFAPAEFEAPLENRAAPEHLDRGRAQVRDMLEHYRGHIESTVFSCGVLYERFAPGGLHNYRLGLGTYRGAEGDFLLNPRDLAGEAAFADHNGEPVTLCLTAAQDVARLVVRSLDLPVWPAQLYMTGERLTVAELIVTVLRARGES
jgi:NmrA-like family